MLIVIDYISVANITSIENIVMFYYMYSYKYKKKLIVSVLHQSNFHDVQCLILIISTLFRKFKLFKQNVQKTLFSIFTSTLRFKGLFISINYISHSCCNSFSL